MPNASISDAIRTLEELISSLDNAYWEATSLEGKDRLYDIISTINVELSELAKLSIQDHGLDYEPITPEFRLANSKLSKLRRLLDDSVIRSKTASKLEADIGDVIALAGN